jgi:hypothetical protein
MSGVLHDGCDDTEEGLSNEVTKALHYANASPICNLSNIDETQSSFQQQHSS